jgi:hypothetical protein
MAIDIRGRRLEEKARHGIPALSRGEAQRRPPIRGDVIQVGAFRREEPQRWEVARDGPPHRGCEAVVIRGMHIRPLLEEELEGAGGEGALLGDPPGRRVEGSQASRRWVLYEEPPSLRGPGVSEEAPQGGEVVG